METTGDDTDADGAAVVPVCFINLAAGAAGDNTDDGTDDDGGRGDGDASPISLTFSLNSESSCVIMNNTKY
jgi:hypothetical protein